MIDSWLTCSSTTKMSRNFSRGKASLSQDNNASPPHRYSHSIVTPVFNRGGMNSHAYRLWL